MLQLVPFLVTVFVLITESALARPIRTNEPGTGVFIGSGVLSQMIIEQESNHRERLWDVTLVGDVRYTPATHWVFGLRIPYTLTRTLDSPLVGTESMTGLGDIIVTAKHRFFRSVGMWSDRHAAIEIGLKLPTGETNKRVDRRLPIQLQRRLQPGSGSKDFIFDLIYQEGWRRFVYGGDISYRLNTEGDARYQFGDEIRLNLDFEYILLPWVYKKPGHELFTLLETTFVHKEVDQSRDRAIGATRRIELLLAPGLQYIATEQLLFSVSGQFPVFSEVKGRGLERDYNVLAEFRFAF